MIQTMAKREICFILILAKMSNCSIMALLGIYDLPISRIKKQVNSGNVGAALRQKNKEEKVNS
jgi:hypothetical protein